MRTVLINDAGGVMTDDLRTAYGTGRLTAPRKAIARAAKRLCGAFTTEELAASVRSTHPRAGATATVYRAIAALEATGSVERVGFRSGSALYAWCGTQGHHHHIVCDSCGRIAHAECPVALQTATGRSDGFVITRHEITLYGLCPACADKKGG
jgi:Fur family ferric uptake transcriptional regulator